MSEKSPINILQEYYTKKLLSPVYTIFTTRGGTHDNIFSCTVHCDNQFGKGVAANKKDAKRLAAEDLISKLIEMKELKIYTGLNENISPSSIPSTSDINLLQNSNNQECIKISSNIPVISNSYINSLQELCTKNNFKFPEYSYDSFGPPHKLTFITKCKVGSLVLEASDETKKKSKHQVAKKMYCHLTDTNIDKVDKGPINAINESNVQLERDLKQSGLVIENLTIDEYSSEKIQNLYKQLSNETKITVANSDQTIANSHYMFHNKYSKEQRKQAYDELLLLHGILEGTDVDLQQVEDKFNYTLGLLDIKSECRNMSKIKTKSANVVLIGIILKTCPILTQVSWGNIYSSAKINAIKGMVEMLRELII